MELKYIKVLVLEFFFVIYLSISVLLCLDTFPLSLFSSTVYLGNFHFHILAHLLWFVVAPLQVLAHLLSGWDWPADLLGLILTDRHHMVAKPMGICCRLRRSFAPPNWSLADLYLLTVSLLIACNLGVGLGLCLTHLLRLKSAKFLGGSL